MKSKIVFFLKVQMRLRWRLRSVFGSQRGYFGRIEIFIR